MSEGTSSDRITTNAPPAHARRRERWLARLFRCLEHPTYANEVDAAVALWPPNGLGSSDALDEASSGHLQLHLERVVPAPPERVFAAVVDAGQFRRWWGPAGFTVPSLQFDAVEGTDYRLVMQPPDGDVFHIRGTFRAVEPPRRVMFSFIYEEPHPDDRETLVTLAFQPNDLGTRVILDQGPFKTAARLELHRQGWTDTLERLERSVV